MHADAEKDQPSWPRDERREYVGREDVDRQDGRWSADRADLLGDASRFDGAAQVTDNDAGRPPSETVNGRCTFARSRVQNDPVSLVDEPFWEHPPCPRPIEWACYARYAGREGE